MDKKRKNKRHFVTIALLTVAVLMAAATSFAGDYVIVDLGTLGGSHSEAYGINDSGQIVGYSTTAAGQLHAFLWTADDGMQDLGTLGGYESWALGISDSGQIVGASDVTPSEYAPHASLWIPATPETMLTGLAAFILAEVALGGIDVEMMDSVLAKVDAASAELAKGNPNAAKVAINNLGALINQVEAQTDKKITPEAAAEIIQATNDIIAALEDS